MTDQATETQKENDKKIRAKEQAILKNGGCFAVIGVLVVGACTMVMNPINNKREADARAKDAAQAQKQQQDTLADIQKTALYQKFKQQFGNNDESAKAAYVQTTLKDIKVITDRFEKTQSGSPHINGYWGEVTGQYDADTKNISRSICAARYYIPGSETCTVTDIDSAVLATNKLLGDLYDTACAKDTYDGVICAKRTGYRIKYAKAAIKP